MRRVAKNVLFSGCILVLGASSLILLLMTRDPNPPDVGLGLKDHEIAEVVRVHRKSKRPQQIAESELSAAEEEVHSKTSTTAAEKELRQSATAHEEQAPSTAAPPVTYRSCEKQFLGWPKYKEMVSQSFTVCDGFTRIVCPTLPEHSPRRAYFCWFENLIEIPASVWGKHSWLALCDRRDTPGGYGFWLELSTGSPMRPEDWGTIFHYLPDWRKRFPAIAKAWD
ncbi:unnamed protein product, partial [Phaeothamnion confervicola]